MIVRFFTGTEVGQITLFHAQLVFVYLIPSILIRLCIAYWLRILANKYGTNPNGWSIFGLFLGLIALILFYVVRIHDMIEDETVKT